MTCRGATTLPWHIFYFVVLADFLQSSPRRTPGSSFGKLRMELDSGFCRNDDVEGSSPVMTHMSNHRMVRHLQMKRVPGIRVGTCHLFIELYAEAGFARGHDIALLPKDRLLQDAGVETAPVLDALEDEKIR